MNTTDKVRYVRVVGPTDPGGIVHLEAVVTLVPADKTPRPGAKLRRSPGDLLCGKKGLRRVSVAVEDFELEPCHKCVERADQLGVSLESYWQNMPGERTPVYTTSPAERDRPYVKRHPEPVGRYRGLEVCRVDVPLYAIPLTAAWYRRDVYHAWEAEVWQVMVDAGVVELYGS